MAAMEQFDHILNWKLKEGSHPFPGKDGGTCINEAAIVAAGFPYQRVSQVEHMPECFSRPICKLAMQLNDSSNDTERQRLLRYVTRLACADTPAIEAKRAAFIKSKNVTAYSFEQKTQTEPSRDSRRLARLATPHHGARRSNARRRTEVCTLNRCRRGPRCCQDGVDRGRKVWRGGGCGRR